MKISLCMIIKNEQDTIVRCLESCKGFVDEYIIGIDDSSTDETESRVRTFFDNEKITADVYKFKWDSDFSKARNVGMNKATGDYILIMDGHEYFPTQHYNISCGAVLNTREILKLIKETRLEVDKPDEAYFQLYQQPFTGIVPNNFFLQPRLYRNTPEFKFGRAAHNTIIGTDPNKSIHYVEIIIIHDAPDTNRQERSKQRVEMNVTALRENIAKNERDTRAYFYLGNTLMEARQFAEAIHYFNKYLQFRIDDNSEKYQVLLHRGLCYGELKDFKSARESLYMAVALDNSRRDAKQLLGNIYASQKDYKRAAVEYTQALTLKPHASRMFQSGPALTYEPFLKLGMIYKELGDIPRAIWNLRQAYRFVPNPAWEKAIKDMSGEKRNVVIFDRIGSFTKDIADGFKKVGCNVVAVRDYDKTLAEWADIIWQEWADDNAVKSTNEYPAKTILRIHGYEYYLNGQIMSQINFKGCKRVVFVCEHIRDKMIEAGLPKDNIQLIYNGVNTEKFSIKNVDREPLNIGYAGYLNEKKNPMLLAQIIKDNPKVKFHLRAEFQSPFLESAFKYETKGCKNITWHGRYDELAEFWNKMSGVISTSIIESFSFNVAEAMACGCQPYVYNWEGAEKIWGKGYIFDRKPKFNTEKITEEQMNTYRKYIIDKYDFNIMFGQILDVAGGGK